MKIIIITIVVMLFAGVLLGETYWVPDDYDTIQLAINASTSGDEIVVRDGTYQEAMLMMSPNLNPPYTRNITLRSENNNPTTCIIKAGTQWEYGVLLIDTHQYSVNDRVTIKGFTFTCDETTFDTHGIYIGDSHVDFIDCLIRDNGMSGIFNSDDISGTITNCTIVSNDDFGIDGENNTINNTIIYYNTDDDIASENNTVTYSCIEDGYTDNIDDKPQFCMETNYEYNLLEGSPCIDTGNPHFTDPDGSRSDMGCYPTIIDIKHCKGEYWNWVSFPKLDRTNDNTVNAPPILDDFIDWPFYLYLQFEGSIVLRYTGTWFPTSYYVKSSRGYKLNPDDSGHHYLPSQNDGSRLIASWELTYTLPANTYNWMGYWLPYTQNIEDAFGEFWDDVYSVDAEDWYYEYHVNETPTSTTTNKNMTYGKSYVVEFYDDIEDFYWTDAVSVEEQQERMVPQNFSFNDLPDYEAIDVMDIPENVLEIGVFEEELCVGAVVVQDTCEQILVYSTSANRGQVPFSFEVITNNREVVELITKYQVMNKETGLYDNRSLISGQQKSSVIMFGNLEDHQNNAPTIDNVSLHGNYPNPFNPETHISFSLLQEQNIELTVYNMKGQKVRLLINGQFSAGEQTILWNGKDDEGKSVGSGLYLYKLRTGDKEFTKKMLLLK